MSILQSSLSALSGVTISHGVSARRCTTFCIGGDFENFIECNDIDSLSGAMRLLSQENAKINILGAGSNLLVNDAGISGYVIRLGKGFRTAEALGEGRFFIGAATSLMTIARKLSDDGFSGIEFAGGIPASFGGAVRMNAGAHGSDMSEIITKVQVVTADGKVEEYARKDLHFAYRTSPFSNGVVVIGAEIQLTPDSHHTASHKRAEFLAERKKRQPLSSPSAGSVFKNPEGSKLSAGALIEQAGLKGFSIGGAAISELHGNWIVNKNKDATASEVSALIAHCQTVVLEKFGVALHPEVVRW